MYYEMTKASQRIKEEQTALDALRLECGDSPALAELAAELSKASIGGCRHLHKGGICSGPSYSPNYCNNECANVIIGADGLGYWRLPIGGW